jgi:hypothetical protein
MVDALRRVSHWVKPPLGCIIDIRPAELTPRVELGLADATTLLAGCLVADEDRRGRHAAADAAVRATVARGEFTIEDEAQFSFYRYPDSADDLRDYIASKWEHTRLEHATYLRVVELMRQHGGARLWLREEVGIRRLLPRFDRGDQAWERR